jgi:ribosomal protein S18 acetylase RimI-like enzyme
VYLRQMTEGDFEAAARCLDRRTHVLRWLVAFLRHAGRQPPEARDSWSLWREAAAADAEPALLAAHFFETATSYVWGDGPAAGAALAELVEEELLPERLVGDREVVQEVLAAAPGIAERASSLRELRVLVSEGAGARLHPGFRPARRADLPLLEEYGRLYAIETGEEMVHDFESLLEHGLLLVIEDAGRVQGYVRSNLTDGRFVHAGGLYVHPAHRGRKVARALAESLAGHVRSTVGAAVVLDAFADNEAAVRSYLAAGYEVRGEGLEVRFAADAWGGG